MIIVVGKWKEKVIKLAAVVVMVAIFAAAIPLVSGLLHDKVPVFSSWFDDEHPSGNPIRVENDSAKDTAKQNNTFNEKMDRFVIKVQNFYYDEKE